MFEDFSFAPAQRKRQQQRFYDPDYRLMTHDIDPLDDGCVSPTTDGSSRGSSPTYNEHVYNYAAPTSTPRFDALTSAGSSRQTSVTELSHYFNKHSLQSRRRSSATSPTSVPFMLRSHDPTHLAVLSTSHANRISRRRTSVQQRSRQCSTAHLHRVASLVEQYLDDSSNPSGSLFRRKSIGRETDFDDPDDDYHPSMIIDEDFDSSSSSSPTSNSFSFAPSPDFPDEGLRSDSSDSYDGIVAPPAPPLLPGDVCSSRRSSQDKMLKPVRMRRRTLTKSRLGAGIK